MKSGTYFENGMIVSHVMVVRDVLPAGVWRMVMPRKQIFTCMRLRRGVESRGAFLSRPGTPQVAQNEYKNTYPCHAPALTKFFEGFAV